MITQKEIARKDFNRVCEINDYEVFTEKQVQGYISHVKGIIQKSEVDNLSEGEIESINIFNEDLPEIHKAIVLNDDLSRELVFYRERKVIFEDSIEKSEGNDIEKARTITGTYANTSQNRKLGRVGKKYDPRDKKAEEDGKGKSEDKKPEMNALDWGKTTEERNSNLDKYEALKTEEEKVSFLKKLKEGGEKKEAGGKPLIAQKKEDIDFQDSPYGGKYAKYKMGTIMKYSEGGKTSYSVEIKEKGSRNSMVFNTKSLEDSIELIDNDGKRKI